MFEVRGPEDFDRVFSAISEAHAGALAVQTTPAFNVEHRRIVDLAARYKLPMVATWPYYATDGGLMSYGPDLAELDRHAGIYVGKILKGAKPADLPVEQPTKFKLVINLKTGKTLGLTMPRCTANSHLSAQLQWGKIWGSFHWYEAQVTVMKWTKKVFGRTLPPPLGQPAA